MACLILSNGDFSIQNFTTANANVGQITINRTASSISVTHSAFASPLVLNGDFRSLVFGGNRYVALLKFDGAGPSTRTISIVDFTAGGSTPGLNEIHNQPLVSNATDTPELLTCPVSEDLILVYSATGTLNEVQRLNIHRSDTGAVVLPGPLTVSSLAAVPRAELTATELIIHHPNSGPIDSTTGPRPAGLCSIIDPPAFGEAVLGASNPALATVDRTATLRNDGKNCLRITSITNSAPYTVTAATLAALPVMIDPGETFDVGLHFAPTTTGTINRTLAVATVPANGANQIHCAGSARAAVASISVSTGSLAFGTVVLPASGTKQFSITNNGEINLNITIAAAPGGSDFTWVPIMAPGLALAVGATTPLRNVDFTPSLDGPSAPQNITVTPSLGTARTIHCTGAGCIPDAKINVPAAAPTPFGQIERGFRTVRLIEITNTGDDSLTFTARIAPGAIPAQVANFGLVLANHDITDAPATRNYSVLPLARCGPGPTGNNVIAVAVGFHADGASGNYAANLVIEGHNASNFPATQTWTFPLTADLIDPIPIDIALVLDRSGSMADLIGTRNKMEAALAGGQLLVQMLRDTDDRCAIIAFSTDPVTERGIVLAGANRGSLLTALGPVTFTPNGWTNIAGGAILGALELAVAHPSSPAALKTAMVVLTDGVENRCLQEGGAGPWLSITGKDNAMARPNGTPQSTDAWDPPAGTKVYAIGLGGPTAIDSAALTQLATGTGGSYQGASDLTGKSWFLLEKYFTQIFMESASLAQITDPFFTIAPGDKHIHEFDILPGDINCMVVIYDTPDLRLPFYVESPRGELFSGTTLPPGFGVRFRSTPTARFAELTFPWKEPDRYVGRWQVIVEHGGYACSGAADKDGQSGFLPRKCRKVGKPIDYGIAIGAGSNLRLQPWVDPVTTYVGDSFRLNAELSEAGLPVTGAQIRVNVTGPTGGNWSVLLRDDGAHQDGSAADGDYGGRFGQTYAAGNYQLTFVADGMQGGKPFHREVQRTKPVYDKRKPPGGDDKGDWCRRLWLQRNGKRPSKQELEEWLAADRGENPKDAPRRKPPVKASPAPGTTAEKPALKKRS